MSDTLKFISHAQFDKLIKANLFINKLSTIEAEIDIDMDVEIVNVAYNDIMEIDIILVNRNCLKAELN